MQENREVIDNPLRNLTPDQFQALGGNAVVYVKHLKGDALGSVLPGADFADDEDYHLVVSADGQPLMIGDSEEAVAEWLQNQPFGIVTLH
ncbi:MAG: DUF1150 family protein [Devosia sp.]